ncbi:FAD-binding oxidoreductase [archaeon]|nr:FAD-binding oxidoreductase [archaeon]MBT6606404.1 FAD-binding oxidoreductase [archaeon]MBT7251427.1 FAD-binding oxidoreductase [archaeon]MBT7660482.1 FAD-binding oxidoreductase [archaeon]
MKLQKNFNGANKHYSRDASHYKGNALDVVHPKSIEELRKIVKTTNYLVGRGGGSGLSGGAVPLAGRDTVINLLQFNKINNFDKERKTVEVGCGVILEGLQDYLNFRGFEFPVNPFSRKIATIGGMIATNAVSSRVGKYGRMAQWIKWIDVMDCQGAISRKGVTEISDYSGMEGTTGIIVRACLKVVSKIKRSATIVPITNLIEMIEIVENLKRDKTVSMIDFCDEIISEGIGLEKKYHLFIEYENDLGLLKGPEYGEFLKTLDTIYSFVLGNGCIAIEDPKIMLSKLVHVTKWFREKNVLVFGHLSAGVLYVCFKEEQFSEIPVLRKLIKRLGGMITFSHGIGVLKRDFVEFNDKKILENVKKRTDPLNKFNVGKML